MTDLVRFTPEVMETTPLLPSSDDEMILMDDVELECTDQKAESFSLIRCNLHHQRYFWRQTQNKIKSGNQVKFSNLRGIEKRIVCLCFLMNVLAGCTLRWLSPFYPLEAESKNVSVAMTGLIFCVFELAGYFLESFTTGRLLPRYGVKFIYIVSLVSATASCFLFSTIHLFTSGASFFLMSLLCRCGQAVGISGLLTSSSVVVYGSLPTSGTSESVLRRAGMGTVLGYVIGPITAGWLFSLGGFSLPFCVIGTVTLIKGLWFYTSVPFPHVTHWNFDGEHSSCDTSTHQAVSTGHAVTFSVVSVFVCGFTTSCLEPILAKHVTDVSGFSTSWVGFVFAISPCVTAILNPLWRSLAEDEDSGLPCHLLGFLVIGAGLAILGPTPLLPFIPMQSWTLVAGLVLVGAGSGCVLIMATRSVISGFLELDGEIEEEDYMCDHNPVNRIFDRSHVAGVFLGPVVGSLMEEYLGFRVATTAIVFVCVTCVVVCVLVSLVCCFIRKCARMLERIRLGGRDDPEKTVDCEQCVIRKESKTFGVLPCQLPTRDFKR